MQISAVNCKEFITKTLENAPIKFLCYTSTVSVTTISTTISMSMMNSTLMTESNFDTSEPFDYNGHYELLFLSQTEHYVLGIVFMFMGLLGVIFNPLTIYIIARGSHMSSKIKIQLINLAVADLLNSIIRPTTNILVAVNFRFPQNLNLCRFTYFVGTIVSIAPLFCKATICVERFALVYLPVQTNRSYKTIHKYLVVTAIWMCSFVLGSIVAYDSEIIEAKYKVFCGPSLDEGFLSLDERDLLYALAFIVPTVIIVTFYMLVFIKLYLNLKASGLRRHLSSQLRKAQDSVSRTYVYC